MTSSTSRLPVAITALAIGAFGIGTTEFTPMGLLPQIAGDLHVSIPTAGWLVTGYALGVLVGAPVMTVLGSRFDRRHALLGLLVLFVLGNGISALAPDFATMLGGRLLASLTHGAFFGIGAVVASDLAGTQRRAGAIARMFTGLTLANLVGVPVGTWLGHTLGWRTTFGIVAAIGVIAMVAVARLVPELPRPAGVRVTHELRALGNTQVVLAMLMTILGFGGVFAAITYIAPLATQVAGMPEGAVAWVMVSFGLGMVLGNALGGRYADRALMLLLHLSFAALAVTLLVFTVFAQYAAVVLVGVFAVGALGFASVPPLQKRVLDHAAGAPTLASAVNIGAFNLGNALAAWLGGVVIAAGLGWSAPLWVGALLAGSALVVAVISAVLERRDHRSTGDAARVPATAGISG